jgi:hypothetical protein
LLPRYRQRLPRETKFLPGESMNQKLTVFSAMCLLVLIACSVATPALAQSLSLTTEGVRIDAFGQSFNNAQSLTFFAVVLALLCSAFLFKRVALNECDCCCGPAKCECGCGCREYCPCFYRDKSAHNDEARRTNYDYY